MRFLRKYIFENILYKSVNSYKYQNCAIILHNAKSTNMAKIEVANTEIIRAVLTYDQVIM